MNLGIERDRSALIVQDLQNDAVSKDGASGGSGAPEHAAEQNVLANVRQLADDARAAGVPVIHVHYVNDNDGAGQQENAPVYGAMRQSNQRGSWGAQAVEGLEPQPGDHVVEKPRVNGFFGTRLDALLRALERDTIVLVGAWTNMSIEHTARHGADAGYRVVVCSDGTSTMNSDWQRASIDYALGNYSTIASCADVSAELGG